MEHNKLIEESANIFGRSLKTPTTKDPRLKEGVLKLMRRGDIDPKTEKGLTPRGKAQVEDTLDRHPGNTFSTIKPGGRAPHIAARGVKTKGQKEPEDPEWDKEFNSAENRRWRRRELERRKENRRHYPEGTFAGSINDGRRWQAAKAFGKRHGTKLAAGAALTAAAAGGVAASKYTSPNTDPSPIQQFSKSDTVEQFLPKLTHNMKKMRLDIHNRRALKRRGLPINPRNLAGVDKWGNRIDPKPEKVEEGSGGEQSLHRKIAAAIKSGGSDPATNPLLRRLEARLKSKQKEGDVRATDTALKGSIKRHYENPHKNVPPSETTSDFFKRHAKFLRRDKKTYKEFKGRLKRKNEKLEREQK